MYNFKSRLVHKARSRSGMQYTLSRISTTLSAWAEGTVLCVCVLPQNCCLNSIITKSKQVAALKLGNLRQTVALYKTG